MTAPPRRHRLLGTFVDEIDGPGLVAWLTDRARRRQATLVTNHNVNSLRLVQDDARVAAVYEQCDLAFIDGALVVAILRLFGDRVPMSARNGVLDWIWPLFETCEREGLRVVHLGAEDETIAIARTAIAARHPDLDLVTISGFFDLERDGAAVADAVAAADGDIVLVGMGMPRQEHWTLAHRAALGDTVVVTVGGILGYLGESRRTPPRWLGPLYLEWAYRLATEPRRLWRRYLVEPIRLVRPVLTEAWRRRRPTRRPG